MAKKKVEIIAENYFEDRIFPWFEACFEQISSQLQTQTLPHALLLEAPVGLGKSIFSKTLASLLLCDDNPSFTKACGQCKSCRLMQAGSHPDFVRLLAGGAGKVISVDAVRECLNFLANTAQLSGRKVVIAEPADAMNLNSANAFLKTLEEPADDTVIILLVDQRSNILPTIRSRCQSITVTAPAQAIASLWLRGAISGSQQPDDVEYALEISQQRPLLALELLEGGGLIKRQTLLKDVEQFLGRQLSVVEFAAKWHKDDAKYALETILSWLQDFCRWLAVPNSKLIMDQRLVPLLKQYSKLVRDTDLHFLIDQFSDSLAMIKKTNPNSQLLLESAFSSLLRWSLGLPLKNSLL